MRSLRWLLAAAAVCLGLVFSVQGAAAKEKVILDTDMVEAFDDGVAMVMLANAPNIDLIGVTCLSGNSWVQEGVAYSLKQLEIEGRNIPVAAGMEYPLRPGRHALFEAERATYGMGHDSWLGSFGLKQPKSWQEVYRKLYKSEPRFVPVKQHAVNFIIDTIRANPHEVTIAAIGPLGNLAAAVRMAPDIIPLIKRVVYMGGAFFQPGNVTPAAEFNWWFDPEAAQVAVRTPFAEQVYFGLDVCEKVVFRKEHYDRLLKTLGNGGQGTILRNTFVGQMFGKDPSFTHYVWDVLVAAYIIDPSVVTKTVKASVDINTQYGLSYGQSIAFQTFAPPGTQKGVIVMDVDQEKFWNMVNDKTYWKSVREGK